MFLRETFLLTLLMITAAANVTAAEEASLDVVFADLNRPCGIAARHGGTAVRYELFIAETGAGRIVRWSNLAPGEVQDAVTGFAAEAAASLFEQTGPLGLLFVDPDLLVVAASSESGNGCLTVFELSDKSQPLTVADAIDRPRDPAPSGSSAGGLSCSSLTRSRANEFVPDMIVAAVRDGGGRGGLYKSRVQAGMVGPLQPFWADGRTHESSPPMVVSTSNTGRIVVTHTDARGDAAAGRLTFLNPIDGSVDLEMPIELTAVVGLAYSPITGRLYVADFRDAAGNGGIYRIDDDSAPGKPACRVVKIADVQSPTALAFAPDGTLYVTTFDTAETRGTLRVLTGNL